MRKNHKHQDATVPLKIPSDLERIKEKQLQYRVSLQSALRLTCLLLRSRLFVHGRDSVSVASGSGSVPRLLLLERIDRHVDTLERVVVVADARLLLLVKNVLGNDGLGLADGCKKVASQGVRTFTFRSQVDRTIRGKSSYGKQSSAAYISGWNMVA